MIGPASNRVIEDGDLISMGLSPTFNGYHGILRRTIRVGEKFTPGQHRFMDAVEGLYHAVMKAAQKAARKNLPSNSIDRAGKKFLERLKLRTLTGKRDTPWEPYTFIHNTGCSECQEGFGAVTPYTDCPLGKRVALMIDIALLGFKGSPDEPLFDILYGVIEDGFWKQGRKVGVYNRLPLDVQPLVGNEDDLDGNVNPYYQPYRSR